jgi:hypothetical protein
MVNAMIIKIRMSTKKTRPGFYLPLVLSLSAIVILITASIITLAYTNFQTVKHQTKSISAMNVAEAGINYYLWHLAKNDKDYCDGQSCIGSGTYGPYVHTYKDTDGNVLGSYSLNISPPEGNGTTVKVTAVGETTSGEKRTLVATLGVPSFARYAFVSNTESWFGNTEQTKGPVHSNRGIHFDGTSDDIVSSAVQTYTPTSCFGGDGHTHNGIWGTGGPQSYWNFPVPSIDFNAITTDLNTLATQAQASNSYFPTLVDNRGRKTYSGYAIQLNANNTYRLGYVTASRDDGGSSGSCAAHSRYNSLMQNVQWESTVRNMPSSGVIFTADNLWVWGTVDTRLTIASGRLPENASTYTNIFLQNDITYTSKDGHASLGLISQSDIVVNSSSENDLVLNAFLMSQKGKVFRPYYPGNTKTLITIYGGVAANSWWTWNWVNSGGSVISGYRNTVQEYDSHLALDPPPSFPKTGSFAILSWKEEPIL